MLIQPQESLVEKKLLRQTNATWNKCQVNHPWSVGYTSSLISHQKFNLFDDWVSYYFDSGDQRDLLVDDILEIEQRLFLRKIDAPKTERSTFQTCPKSLQKLNLEMGRSWEAVYYRSCFFQKALKSVQMEIDLGLCKQLFLQRVLVDTWNGYVREQNTCQQLQKAHPTIRIESSDAWEDFHHGVDFILFDDQKSIGAIQIKPASYRSKAAYVLKAKAANLKKNKAYTARNNTPVWVIISEENGEILDDGGLNMYLENRM